MPTNLPPQCKELEAKYLEAKTLPAKIKALEEYHSAIPKHKGTERLRSEIKRKISKFKLEIEEKKRQRSMMGQASGRYAVKKEGAAQIVILGATGSGKSSLLRGLTNAKPEIGTYSFTTIRPIPGMMSFEDIQIQLVEAPALFEDASKGKGWGTRTLSLARNADGLILLVDLAARDPCAQLEMIVEELNSTRIRVEEAASRIEIERRASGGIQFTCDGKYEGEMDEIRQFLVENGVNDAVVRIWGDVDLDDVALSLVSGMIYRPALVVANKIDIDEVEEKLERLKNCSGKLPVIGVSTTTNKGLEEVPPTVFKALNLRRIYTKKPRQRHSKKPMIMRGETTVEDVAKDVHSTFYTNFKYAKVWGSTKYPGERVGLKYFVQDGDIVELHA